VPSGASSDDFKELVRSRTDIVQLVGERVALQSRRGGREFFALCPFHDDHNPSMIVNPERQSFKCWVCDVGGDCFAFVQKIENVDFREALELLATRAGLEMPRYGRGTDGKNPEGVYAGGKPTRKELFDALAWAEGEFHNCLRTSQEGEAGRAYLESRGFSREAIERFRLGFAPADGQFLQRRATQRFKSPQVANALLSTVRLIAARAEGNGYYDYFRGRVMFPIRDPAGRTVAFGGRVLPGATTNAGKYVNSAESGLFAKNRVVFALDVARDAIVKRDAAVVMEGYADCIMAHQFGITNAVATLGTALTDNHVAALRRFTRRVILVFDGDKAGKEAAEKSLPRFLSQEIDLRILTLTSEKDPADFLVSQGAAAFEKLLETAAEAWEYKLRLCIERIGVDSIDGREQIVAEMLELFRQAPGFGGSARENIVLNRLAFRVGLSETRIREMLVESRRKAAKAAAGIAKAGAAKTASAVHGSHATAAHSTGSNSTGSKSTGSAKTETNSPAARLERELLEFALSDPTAVDVLRSSVNVDEFEQVTFRRLLTICYRLVEEGHQPSYDKVMSAAEDPVLKQLVVTLESAARDKAQKLRLDCAFESHEDHNGRHALLAKLIEQFKHRADAQDASLERMALQSGLSGSGPAGASHSGTGSAGVLDAAQLEALRRATDIHGRRAGKRGATQDRAGGRESSERANGRDESGERATGHANAKTTN
jgi:DNA primase